MFRKMIFGALTLLLALTLVGCGGKKDEAKPEAKTEAALPAFSADKAVLAYAQLYAYGVPDDEKAAGLTDNDMKPVQEKVIGELLKSFAQFPLSDENVQRATTDYIAKVKAGMEIKAALKKDDKEHPVVELTAQTIDQAGAAQLATTNEDLLALGMALGELHQQGITDDQLKANPEFQDAVLDVIDKYTSEIPLNPISTIEITCKLAEGSDGKMYWAPEDPTAVAKFVAGQQ